MRCFKPSYRCSKSSRIMLFAETARGPVSVRLSEAKYNQNSGNGHAHPGKPVVEASVEGGVRAEIIGQVGGVADIAAEDAGDIAVRIDGCSYAAVGVADDPSAVFDGADTDHAEVLFGGFGLPEPAVVRDVDQQFSAPRNKGAHFHGVNCFVADEDGKGVAVREFADGAIFALVEAAHFFRDAGDDLMDKRKRLVFAERNKMNFVVRKNALTVVVQHRGAVVGKEDGTLGAVEELGAGLPFDDADNDGTAKFRGQVGD